MKFVPEKLKQCRDSLGLSIDRLMAELSKVNFDVASNTLRNWEEGKSQPDANDLAILSSFYGKPVQYFFSQNSKQTV